MSEFDDLVFDMDQVVGDVFGDPALLTAEGQDYPVQAVIERGAVQVGINEWLDRVTVSIAQPPVELKNGQTVQIIETTETFTLREELEDDGYMSVWVVT